MEQQAFLGHKASPEEGARGGSLGGGRRSGGAEAAAGPWSERHTHRLLELRNGQEGSRPQGRALRRGRRERHLGPEPCSFLRQPLLPQRSPFRHALSSQSGQPGPGPEPSGRLSQGPPDQGGFQTKSSPACGKAAPQEGERPPSLESQLLPGRPLWAVASSRATALHGQGAPASGQSFPRFAMVRHPLKESKRSHVRRRGIKRGGRPIHRAVKATKTRM